MFFFNRLKINKVNIEKKKIVSIELVYNSKKYIIKKLNPLNHEVRELILYKYRKKKIPSLIYEDFVTDNEKNMITAGLFEENTLILTLSLKIRNLNELIKKCSNTDDRNKKNIYLFFDKLINNDAYKKQVYEFTRFSSLKENLVVIRRIFPMLIVFLLTQIDIKNSILISNCSTLHRRFYTKIFTKNEIFYSEPFYIFNPIKPSEKLESNLIFFKNLLKNKHIKPYFELVNAYVSKNIDE